MGKKMNPALQVIEMKKRIAFLESAIVVRENAAVNMAKDASLIAAKEIFQLGPGRSKAYCDAFDQAMLEMLHMCNDEATSTTDSKGNIDISIDYTKAKIDEKIRSIVGDENFVPFEERYCWNDVTLLMQTPVGKVRLKNE